VGGPAQVELFSLRRHTPNVKACSWCGRKNLPDSTACLECGTPLPTATASPLQTEDPPDSQEPELLDCSNPPPFRFSDRAIPELSELDMPFDYVEGFSRPDWDTVRGSIRERVRSEDLFAAWDFAAQKWLQQLAQDLGGGARVYDSGHFLCVSDADPGTVNTLLNYAEGVLPTIRANLRGAAWIGYHGRHVLLLFSDPDDYYAYVSFFHEAEVSPLSGGVCLGRGYTHIAMPLVNVRSAEHTIVHELVHNLVVHLRLPLWLNEALAMVIESRIERRPFLLDRDEVDRHRQHWNPGTIQEFWAGTAFGIPGESNHLSYKLSEILLNLLLERQVNLVEFIKNADWRDGGQDAALNLLSTDLGALAADFLGPGDWRPRRKTIAALLKLRPT